MQILFRILIFLTLFFSCNRVYGQDTIYTVNKKKIVATIVEINQRDVKYKKLNIPADRIYLIDKRDVIRIVYSNGIVDTISPRLLKMAEKSSMPLPVQKPDPRATDYFRNYTFLTVTDLFFGMISVGYERTFKSGKGSLLIPASFGMVAMGLLPPSLENRSSATSFLPGGAYYFKNKIFSSGMELYYFPHKQGTIKHFIGPALEYGMYNYFVYESIPSLPGYFNIEKQTSQFYTFSIKNGLLIQPSKNFNITAFLGVGLKNFSYFEQNLKF